VGTRHLKALVLKGKKLKNQWVGEESGVTKKDPPSKKGRTRTATTDI